MADFTDQDKELLDKLRKGFERDAKTRPQLDPWQELIDRDETVNASRAAAAAKILEGFAGSWAAQYNYGYGSTLTPTGSLVSEAVAGVDPQGPPVPIRAKVNKLGRRGVPEINFVPYNWRTNTFGNKGPSLVGHPIGFEVVGPTLKSPFMDWTWRVLPGAGVGGGDLLRMDVRADGGPNVVFPYAGNIAFAYGPFLGSGWEMGGGGIFPEPNGGRYLVITDDGNNPGSIPPGRLPMPALDRFVDTARFEVFRIVAVPLLEPGVPYEIHLHPDKPLSRYFDISNDPDLSIRAVTVLAPYVTRLAAVPQSGAAGGSDGTSVSGREQAFVVVSPERAASGDNFPPFDGGTAGDGTWVQGGFTDSRAPGTTTGGEPTAYGGKNRLPVPNPVYEVAGNVETDFISPSTLVGQWAVEVSALTVYTTGIFSSDFPIVRYTVTQRDDDLARLSLGTIPSCLGWFDMVGTNGVDKIHLNRVPETDPQTGLTYWGPGPFIVNALAAQNVGLFGTLHQPISSLWQNEFNLDNVESSRLKNLIDPQWVHRFEKQLSDPLLAGGQAAPPPGSGPGRPDRAIFDTRTFAGAGPVPNAADPGNLMDLGFRMVLFPAKEDPAGAAIPDFDRPITGREVVIDGSIQEKQYVEVDYSSGVVRLSHPPPESRASVPLAPSDIIPNGIPGEGANNPRGEVVLFAACVPYSMEDSQVGGGLRLTSSEGDGVKDVDVYSDTVWAKIDLTNTTFVGASPFIGPSVPTGNPDIILDRLWDGPETGVITIQSGSGQGAAFGRWGYTQKILVTIGSLQVTGLGGLTALPGAFSPDPSLFAGAQTRYVVLRREVVFSRESFSVPALTDFAPSDTYYGSSVRADTLRFERASLIPELDGSMRVRPRPDLAPLAERGFGGIMPAILSEPTDTVVNPAPPFGLFFYPDERGLLSSLSYQTTPGDPRGTNPGMRYFAGVTGSGLYFDQGPAMELSAAGGTPNYYGFITQDGGIAGRGRFFLGSNFRWVAKVGLSWRNAAADMTGFVGLIQDTSGPGLSPTISTLTDPATAPPVHWYCGFQFDTSAGVVWRFWTRGSSGVDNLIAIPGATADPSLIAAGLQGPFYFVIETPRVSVVEPDGVIVKMGAFDRNKNLLSSINVTHTDLLPSLGGRGLFTACAVRENTLNPAGGDMFMYFINVVCNTGLDDLPPLP